MVIHIRVHVQSCIMIFVQMYTHAFQRQIDEKSKLLEEEERRNQLLERDVTRYRHRQTYIETVKRLKMKKLWVVSF